MISTKNQLKKTRQSLLLVPIASSLSSKSIVFMLHLHLIYQILHKTSFKKSKAYLILHDY